LNGLGGPPEESAGASESPSATADAKRAPSFQSSVGPQPIVELAHIKNAANANVELATFSPDGKRVLHGSLDGVVRLWDRKFGRLIHSIEPRGGSVYGVAISPDGHHALSGGEDRIVRLWNLDSGKLVRELKGHTEPVLTVTFSPDGRLA
jgi:WD40 repeat protein